jgi:hypothetical protein
MSNLLIVSYLLLKKDFSGCIKIMDALLMEIGHFSQKCIGNYICSLLSTNHNAAFCFTLRCGAFQLTSLLQSALLTQD